MQNYIIVNKSKERNEFYAIDQANGGYPYWSTNIKDAIIFTDSDNALKALESSDFTQSVKMMDKTEHPPRMIHSALGLNNSKQSGSGLITIMQIIFNPVKTIVISGEITRKNPLTE